MTSLLCRGCGVELHETFADLGTAPLSNAYLSSAALTAGERYFPLHARVCSACYLVQLDVHESPEGIFASDYAYFSSYSQTWLDHARDYVENVTQTMQLNGESLVVEIASNDGYLLKNFVAKKIPVLGVEPAENVAEVARKSGVRTESTFFGAQTARDLSGRYGRATLMVANNVLAHVPDLHDFVEGFSIMLAPGGRASIEFPHLMRLIESAQFDTIYHEHFSYFSLTALLPVFETHGLIVTSVEELPTHGGSLRIWIARRADNLPEDASAGRMLDGERSAGMLDMSRYRRFGSEVARVKREFLGFLLEAQAAGKTVAGYGAAAKANTLLNYCGVRSDAIAYVVDRSPHKQGRYLPGSRIPIHAPEKIFETRPDYVVVFPWNIKDEILHQMAAIRDWGGRFVTAIPALQVE